MATALPNVGKGQKYGDLKRRLLFLLGAAIYGEERSFLVPIGKGECRRVRLLGVLARLLDLGLVPRLEGGHLLLQLPFQAGGGDHQVHRIDLGTRRGRPRDRPCRGSIAACARVRR